MATPFESNTLRPQGLSPTTPARTQSQAQAGISPAGGLTPQYLKQMRTRSRKRRSNKNARLTTDQKLRKQDFTDFPEDVRNNLFVDAGLGLLSGVEAIANVYDLAGSSVRDVIGGTAALAKGDTEKASEYNPFDQLQPKNWMSFENRKESRDIYRDMGLANQEDTWANFGTGLVGDIATDPFTYSSFGLAPLARKGVGFLTKSVRAGLEGIGKSTSNLSPAASNILDKGLSRAAEDLPYLGRSAQLANQAIDATSRYSKALFSKGTSSTTSHAGQRLSPEILKATSKIESKANSWYRGMAKDVKKLGIDITDNNTINEVYRFAESPTIKATKNSDAIDFMQHIEDKVTGEVTPVNMLNGTKWDTEGGKKFLRDFIRMDRHIFNAAEKSGLKISRLQGVIGHAYRQKAQMPGELQSYFQTIGKRKDFNIETQYQKQRLDLLNVGEGGTELVNRITSDPDIVGILAKHANALKDEKINGKIGAGLEDMHVVENELANKIQSKYSDTKKLDGRVGLPDYITKEVRDLKELRDSGNLTAKQIGDIDEKIANKTQNHFQALAKWVGNLDEGYIKNGGFFNQDPLKVMLDARIQLETATTVTNHMATDLAKMAFRTADDFTNELSKIGNDIASLELQKTKASSVEDIADITNQIREKKRRRVDWELDYETFVKSSDKNTVRIGDLIAGQDGIGLDKRNAILNISRRRAEALGDNAIKEKMDWFPESGMERDPSRILELEKIVDDILPSQIENAKFLGDEAAEISLRSELATATKELDDHIKDVATARVPRQYANDIKRITQASSGAGELHSIIEFAHKVTGLWKGAVTGPFLAFHGRNRAGGEYQNILFGVYGRGANIPKILKEAYDQNLNTMSMLSGKDIKGAASWDVFQDHAGNPIFKTDREATDRLIELIIDNDVIGGGNLQDLATMDSGRLDDLKGILEGRMPQRNPLKSKAALFDSLKNYFDVYNKRQRSGPLDIRMGQNLGDITEAMNRIPGFISQIKRAKRAVADELSADDLASFSPEEISKLQGEASARAAIKNESIVSETARESALRMKLAQIDYEDLTPWEKDYVKLIIPFYSFQKGIVKAVGSELYKHPEGGLRQSMRVEAAGTRQDKEDIEKGNVLPEYMKRGGAFNLGRNKDGDLTAITSLGLMHGAAEEFVGNPFATALGMINPAIKFGIEKATGRSLYFDQPLSQLDPAIGRSILNTKQIFSDTKPEDTPPPQAFISPGFEHFMQQTPASRFISTYKKATDKRKNPFWRALNLTTGLKYSTVSPEKSLNASRALLTDMMVNEGAREWSSYSFSKNRDISEKQAAILSLQRDFSRTKRAADKQKKELEGQAGK